MVAAKRESRRYRNELEREVLAVKREITLLDAHLIDTAAAATAMAGICRWLLRNRIDNMTVNDIRACNADIVKAKMARDKAVRVLGIDVPPPEPWAVVNARVVEDDELDKEDGEE